MSVELAFQAFQTADAQAASIMVMPLPEHGPIPSMRRKGNCWDNARMERFVGSLKRGRTDLRLFTTRKEAGVWSTTSRCSTTANGATPIWTTSAQ